MTKSFEVLWTVVAEKDLLGIVRFIADDDPRAALGVLRKIKSGTAKLDHSPMRGRAVPALLRHGISRYREIVVKPWRVIYRIDKQNVYVVAVIDGRRNVEDLLLTRLLE